MRTRSTTPLPSEALYGFMGWLTTREEESGPFSKIHDAAEAADLVAAYCEYQGWENPRGSFPEYLKHGPIEVKSRIKNGGN